MNKWRACLHMIYAIYAPCQSLRHFAHLRYTVRFILAFFSGSPFTKAVSLEWHFLVHTKPPISLFFPTSGRAHMTHLPSRTFTRFISFSSFIVYVGV